MLPGVNCSLQEILRLRTTREELGRLLGRACGGNISSGGSAELDQQDVFKPFRSMAALRYDARSTC